MDVTKVTKWLKDSTSGHLKSVNQTLRCAFCWRGANTGEKTNHIAEACPWLHTLNHHRTKASLSPIEVRESHIHIGNERRSATAESIQKDLGGMIAKLEKRVAALELQVQQLTPEPQVEGPKVKKLKKEAKKAAKAAEKGRAK
jgi:phage FluMu protein Com